MKRVTARERGFYLCIREIGDEFSVPDDLQGDWFVVNPSQAPEQQPEQSEGKAKKNKSEQPA